MSQTYSEFHFSIVRKLLKEEFEPVQNMVFNSIHLHPVVDLEMCTTGDN